MRKTTFLGVIPLLAPVQLLLLCVVILPALYVVWLSFHLSSFGQAPEFVGWQNYLRVLSDPAFRSAMWNTVIIVVVAVHLEMLVALGMALLCNSGVKFRRFLLVAVLAPYAVSEVVAVAMWRFLFDLDIGPVTLALQALGLPVLEWSYEPSHAMIMIILLTIWMHLPFTFVILYAARLAMPADLYEAARIDGATRLQCFWRVTLPLMGPAIIVALLFRYIFAFRMFSEVWLLTGGGPARSTEVVAVYLYQEAFSYNAFGTASATALLMVIASLVLASGYIWLLRRQVKNAR
ncbi:multiple sugar transport system permease protein [Gemmobacter caeni]|uniref:Carbohydrate ABC transporter membrane protein 1 (CUT1 family) n=1 Tax=Gemmobacter caeni TaxID=589035 RepID=A0A2T6AWL3_9RHOB|nr:sugar ABC transporter permease [Gemmobacter caeni]PTX48181.1 carbohydrate ABC transporter membrane protein 1 (CUT1 family) [Gemmobacter caeni]TWI96953.1 multiple sugar transport system permease protein [Gemmobacter caeni]